MLVITVAAVATETTAAVTEDVGDAWERVPTWTVTLLDAVGLLAVLVLVVAVVVEHLVRRKVWALGSGFAAALVAGLVANAVPAWIAGAASPSLRAALDLGAGSMEANAAIVVAFLTAADLASTPWRLGAAVIVAAILVPGLAVGALGIIGVVVAVLFGRVAGLAARLTLGVVILRPGGAAVRLALERAGLDLTSLREEEPRALGRSYVADLADGTRLDVVLSHRLGHATGLLARAWRLLRFRSVVAGRVAWSTRAIIEHEALASYAGAAVGANVARPRAFVSVPPEALLLARESVPGEPLSALGEEQVDDALLRRVCGEVRTLHRARVAHRNLVPETIRVDDAGRVGLVGMEEAAVAASELQVRLDLAHLLVALALVTEPRRAVAAATAVFGSDVLVPVAGFLQAVALPLDSRRRLREAGPVLATIQEQLLAGAERPEPAPAQLERLRPRTVVTFVVGTVAAYVLAGQLGSVDLVAALRDAAPEWALVALVGSAATYVGAAVSLVAFAPGRLPVWRTAIVQLAASFVTLVTPPAVGQVTLNLRYLRRADVPGVVAVTVVGLNQLVNLAVTVVLLLALGLLSGAGPEPSFIPSGTALLIVAILGALVLVLVVIPRTRRLLAEQLVTRFRQALPRFLELLHQPWRFAIGVVANLIVTVGYLVALAGSLAAFGIELDLVQTAIVLLAGTAVGSAAPTPGGLGAVEAALTAGLAAAGVPGSAALPAVLLYRTVTFWLPVAPGWLAFAALQRRQLV